MKEKRILTSKANKIEKKLLNFKSFFFVKVKAVNKILKKLQIKKKKNKL